MEKLMHPEYFTLHESIVDRDDLTIYEKMCCVVLARYTGKKQFQDRLSRDVIAIKMGCSNDEAHKAIEGLIKKGILESDSSDIEINEMDKEMRSNIVRELDSDYIKDITFEELHNKITVKNQINIDSEIEQKIEVVREMIEEVISDKGIRILLNISGGDIDLIKKKYAIAKMSQLNDVMEVLMHELQKKEPKIISQPIQIDSETKTIANQINQKRIAELYKAKKGKI